MVPGRKTDAKECTWLAELLELGLLRASFIPPQPIRALRELTRYRKTLVQEHTREVNRVHKLLESANLKLGAVATDIMGASGRALLRALIAGERDGVVTVQRMSSAMCPRNGSKLPLAISVKMCCMSCLLSAVLMRSPCGACHVYGAAQRRESCPRACRVEKLLWWEHASTIRGSISCLTSEGDSYLWWVGFTPHSCKGNWLIVILGEMERSRGSHGIIKDYAH
jgi:hypothetical protein